MTCTTSRCTHAEESPAYIYFQTSSIQLDQNSSSVMNGESVEFVASENSQLEASLDAVQNMWGDMYPSDQRNILYGKGLCSVTS